MQLNSQLKFLLFLKNKRLKEFRNCNSVGKSNSGGKKYGMYGEWAWSILLGERETQAVIILKLV